jgi:hypothetical protein
MSHLLPGALEDDEHLPRLFVPRSCSAMGAPGTGASASGGSWSPAARRAVYTKCKARGVVNRASARSTAGSRATIRWPFASERIWRGALARVTLIRAAIDSPLGCRMTARCAGIWVDEPRDGRAAPGTCGRRGIRHGARATSPGVSAGTAARRPARGRARLARRPRWDDHHARCRGVRGCARRRWRRIPDRGGIASAARSRLAGSAVVDAGAVLAVARAGLGSGRGGSAPRGEWGRARRLLRAAGRPRRPPLVPPGNIRARGAERREPSSVRLTSVTGRRRLCRPGHSRADHGLEPGDPTTSC